ncbi:hypothetical protein DL98DRAFT_657536 [Cadophora sp. DSE1049]|nr:hypothetical protein DL98DRAFT_657536 [Cadophora sp. DSE1049]
MGFVVTVNHDKEEVTVTLGGKIVSLFHPKNLKDGLQAHLEWSGGDYFEPYAERLICDADFLAKALLSEGDNNKALDHRPKDTARTTNKGSDIDKSDETMETGDRGTELAGNGHGTQTALHANTISKTVDPMNDAVVNVLWQGYHDTTIETLQDRFETMIESWNVVSPDKEAWISRLTALKSSKVPITQVVALGLGSHRAA